MATNEKIYFSKYLRTVKDYDIRLIFPENENSHVSKEMAGELIEDSFFVEADESLLAKYKDEGIEIDREKYIASLFNYEISKRVMLELKEKHNALVALHEKSESLYNKDDKKEALLSDNGESLSEEIKLLENAISESRKTIEEFDTLMNEEETIKDFHQGIISYGNLNTSKAIIESKKEKSHTQDFILVSDALKLIDEAMAHADNLIAKIDAIFGMDKKKVIKESAEIDKLLPVEAKNKLEEKAINIAPKENPKPKEVQALLEEESQQKAQEELDNAMSDTNQESTEDMFYGADDPYGQDQVEQVWENPPIVKQEPKPSTTIITERESTPTEVKTPIVQKKMDFTESELDTMIKNSIKPQETLIQGVGSDIHFSIVEPPKPLINQEKEVKIASKLENNSNIPNIPQHI